MSNLQRFETVTEAVLAFLNADSWGESKRIVEQNRDLLLTDAASRGSGGANEVFANLLSQGGSCRH